jgi:WD40 repeat protein
MGGNGGMAMALLARGRRGPAPASVLLAALLVPTMTAAQERVGIEVVPPLGHAGDIKAATFSTDGARVLTGGQDGTVKLWDAATARLVRTFPGHSTEVTAVAFSPDGTRVASAAARRTAGGKTVKLWDAATGRLILGIATEPRYTFGATLAFSPDGRSLLVGDSDGTARLVEAASGRLVREFEHGVPSKKSGHRLRHLEVAFSADGSRVLTGGPGATAAKLWDTASGRLVQSFGAEHGDWVRLAPSPDGTRVLLGRWAVTRSTGAMGRTSVTYALQLWDAATGKLLHELKEASVDFVAFARDGTPLVGSYRGLEAWDLEAGRLAPWREGPPGGFKALAVSPDGTRVLAGPDWRGSPLWKQPALTLWDKASGIVRSVTMRRPRVVSLAVSLDGARVLTGSAVWRPEFGVVIREWDAATGRPVARRAFRVDKRTLPDAFTPDGTRLYPSVVGPDGPAGLWDVASAMHIRDLEGPARRVAFSADGRRMVQGGNRTVEVRDVATSQVIRTISGLFEGEPTELRAVALSSDGGLVAVGDTRDTVRVWETATGRLVQTLAPARGWFSRLMGAGPPVRPLDAVAFSPDGTRLVACLSGFGADDIEHLKLWDVARGKLIRAFDKDSERAGKVFRWCTVAFSPDGARIVSVDAGAMVSSDKRTRIKLWETATGRLVRAFDSETGTKWAAFSRDGRRLVSAGRGGTIEVRDAGTGESIATLIALIAGAEREEWLAVTAEGFFDASSTALAREMLTIVRGLEVLGEARHYEALHRPDLVRAKLAGDPDGAVKAAAAELEGRLASK